ncbi:hypothetical protein ACL02O_31490 [Micromonospora sp. MS34]|uniref:hypothetical protein n=1 Tax=Micromonospora sp. MS34 TaxID=3385971 RepID=UPI00399F4952
MTAEGFELGLNSFGEVAADGDRIPSDAEARTIELLGSEVAPRVRELLAKEPTHV